MYSVGACSISAMVGLKGIRHMQSGQGASVRSFENRRATFLFRRSKKLDVPARAPPPAQPAVGRPPRHRSGSRRRQAHAAGVGGVVIDVHAAAEVEEAGVEDAVAGAAVAEGVVVNAGAEVEDAGLEGAAAGAAVPEVVNAGAEVEDAGLEGAVAGAAVAEVVVNAGAEVENAGLEDAVAGAAVAGVVGIGVNAAADVELAVAAEVSGRYQLLEIQNQMTAIVLGDPEGSGSLRVDVPDNAT